MGIKQWNAGIIRPVAVPPTGPYQDGVASGVWTMDQVAFWNKQGLWPTAGNTRYWISTLGNPPGEAFGYGIALDSSGNIFTCGFGYDGTGDNRIVLAKYNNSGNLQWQRTLNSTITDTDQSYALATDTSGNVYVVGYAAVSGGGVYDLFIAKYNTSGTIQWQRKLAAGSSSYEVAYGVATDSSDNVYVTGFTGVSNSEELLIVKYNSSGTIQWQRKLSGASSDYGYAIATDSSSNVYAVGTTDVSGNYDLQIVKYNSSGTIQWQRKLVGTGSSAEVGRGIAVDSSGNVYICGQTDSGISTSDILVAKYDTSGAIQWQRRLGSSTNDDVGNSIAVDSSGNVYICGDTDTPVGIQIAKYNTSGTLQWQRSLNYTSVSSRGRGIAVDTSGNFYISGQTYQGGAGRFITAKLPTDGTMTGTYGGFIYASSSLTGATPTLTSSASSLTDSSTSLTGSTPTLEDAAGPFTAAKIAV